VCILVFALLPHTAQAALDCTVKSAQLAQGHANIYIVPLGTIAINDFVGTENQFEIIYRCKVIGTPTQWAIVERQALSVTNTGTNIYWNPADNFPVLTNTTLTEKGLGFSGFYFYRGNWQPSKSWNLTSVDMPSMPWEDLPTADSEGYVELGITLNYRFSKINDNLDITGNPVTVQALPFSLAAFAIRDNESTTLSPIAHVTATMPTLTIAQRGLPIP